ncbi:MAG: nucleotide exchange factor GrpE [Eubacteriales bacterium]
MLFLKKFQNHKKTSSEPSEFQLQITKQLTDVEELLQKSIKRQRKVESTIDSMSELIEEHTDSFLIQSQIQSRESFLIQTLIEQDEYLYRLSSIMKQGSTTSNWIEQIHSMQSITHQKLRTVNLHVISDEQVLIDFQIHEVIDIFPTYNISNKNKVYQIITPGYLYQGTILKKATIIAYKYEEKHK